MIPVYLGAFGLVGGILVSFGVAYDRQRMVSFGTVAAIVGFMGGAMVALMAPIQC
jgi:hypothetical protein